jgi:hypothetical protein
MAMVPVVSCRCRLPANAWACWQQGTKHVLHAIVMAAVRARVKGERLLHGQHNQTMEVQEVVTASEQHAHLAVLRSLGLPSSYPGSPENRALERYCAVLCCVVLSLQGRGGGAAGGWQEAGGHVSAPSSSTNSN